MDIPITFEYKGLTYTGRLSRISGSGSTSSFHLYIGKFYRGKLWYSDYPGHTWRFASNDRMFEELAEWFGMYVIEWYDGLENT